MDNKISAQEQQLKDLKRFINWAQIMNEYSVKWEWEGTLFLETQHWLYNEGYDVEIFENYMTIKI